MEEQNITDKIFFHGKEYFCTLDLALDKIGGKWKIIMIYLLQDGALRSSDLQRKMQGVSNKMFTQTARELEHNGIVRREVYPVVPPRVEYSLTPVGLSILPIVRDLAEWATHLPDNTLTSAQRTVSTVKLLIDSNTSDERAYMTNPPCPSFS